MGTKGSRGEAGKAGGDHGPGWASVYSQDKRDAIIADAKRDEDHASEGLGPGQPGPPTRIILVSGVGTEGITLWRFDHIMELVSTLVSW